MNLYYKEQRDDTSRTSHFLLEGSSDRPKESQPPYEEGKWTKSLWLYVSLLKYTPMDQWDGADTVCFACALQQPHKTSF